MNTCKKRRTRNKTIKTAEIRQSFLDYFVERDHKLVPSSPVIPFDDPTILFINAGMNQFKDIFTGQRKPDAPRATSVQKCLRAGGKHNDLDNVGFTARHHTFFEMLGNWSFGDYYKEEAIVWAWEWVTKVLGLPKDRIYATVYETDDEAFALWEKIAPELKNGRVMRFGKKDNYWSMGDLGPCGPCSEIHFDRGEKYGTGSAHVVNGETDRFVEIWNLVFMQFDQRADGKLVDLPQKCIDTGAGLERLAAIMQNVDTNYGIDLFQNLIATVSELTGTKYTDNKTSHHVVSDHIRALTFSLADGAGISNEGRGYVLRRILRRAARHGRSLGATEPFIYKLVPTLVDEMGETYPEIREKQAHIASVIEAEEVSFLRTLDTGLELFSKVAKKLKADDHKVVPGDEAFRLYDTYGFPYDLTEIIASEQGLTVDQAGFDKAMQEQQSRSRSAGKFVADSSQISTALDDENISLPATSFVRESLSLEGKIQYTSTHDDDIVALILEQSPFYVEAGGQVGDVGIIIAGDSALHVKNVFEHKSMYIHEGNIVKGSADDFKVGATVTATVETDRRWDIMRNHTATHLAHAALRKVLGDHVKQSGSYVGPDRLRFDFSHHQPMTPEQIAEVESLVNREILNGATVNTELMDVESAKKSGAMALFGEKYGDKVRVVSVSDFSKELCGGTHVDNVAQIGPFFITLETGIASGVRRLEAITGVEAQRQMLRTRHTLQEIGRLVGRPTNELLAAIEQDRNKVAQQTKEIKALKTELVSGDGRKVGESRVIDGIRFWFHNFNNTDEDTMEAWVDAHKNEASATVAIAIGNVDGKSTVIGAASGSAVKEQGVNFGQIAKEAMQKFGGRGGGRTNFARGSVPEGTTAEELVIECASILGEQR